MLNLKQMMSEPIMTFKLLMEYSNITPCKCGSTLSLPYPRTVAS